MNFCGLSVVCDTANSEQTASPNRITAVTIDTAVSHALSLLNLQRVDSGSDPRWQAIIEVGKHIESSPGEVWQFISCARVGADEDLEAALTTVLLEHLIEQNEEFKQKAYEAAKTDKQMKGMLRSCW